MTAPVTTGVEAVDRELERRAPFASTEMAEAVANQLLAVWRLLQPSDSYTALLHTRRTVHRR